ncbi:MAG: class I SAM-dependent methyltransferase [Pseudomonadota bacterium]
MVAGAIETRLKRMAYGAASTAKVGWYTAFYVAGRHMVGPMTKPGEVPRPSRTPVPDMKEMRSAFFRLFQDEWADIEAGRYVMPKDLRHPPRPSKIIRDAQAYLKEAREVSRRANRQGGGVEVRDIAEDDLPTYYKQNFHFQSDGWLSEESAQVYDTQVEVLFTGSASAMRRRGLALIMDEVRRLEDEGRHRSGVHLADVACGTGRLLSDIVDNVPELQITAVDLSEPYLDEARKAAVKATNTEFVRAAAEDLPLTDGNLDILTTVYLFHELPPKVRREVAAEIARTLKPGGLYVHVDSVQYGDTGMDLMLESFPRAFHEPYYDSYCHEPLSELFGEVGLRPENQMIGFLTKATSFRKA